MNCLRKIYRKLFPVKVRGNNNIIKWKQQYRNVRIDIYGNNNKIIIEKASTLSNIHITMYGDNNQLIIGKNCRIYGPCYFSIENGAIVKIGENTGIRGLKLLARKVPVTIGANCMTSYNILIRNHDSHIIFKNDNQEIINHPEQIIIGDHVWIGEHVTVLKGSKIGNNSVIGFGSIITREIPSNSIAVGIPAKVVKSGINWGV